MTLDESARLYLADYYLLEQARDGANRFLEGIAKNLAMTVREHLSKKDASPVVFGEWVQRGGGAVEFYVKRQDIPELDDLGEWKYSVCYRDAMRTEKLSDTTKCLVYGYTPKSNSSQASELTRMARVLGLPDPYASNEFELLNESVDEVIDNLARTLGGYLDNYVTIVQALAQEAKD